MLEIIQLWSKMSEGLVKNVIRKMFTYHVYLIYKSKQDLTFNNSQYLYDTKPNQLTKNSFWWKNYVFMLN